MAKSNVHVAGQFEYGFVADVLDERLTREHPIAAVLTASQPVLYRLDLLRTNGWATLLREMDRAHFAGVDDVPEVFMELMKAEGEARERIWERIVRQFVARHVLPLFARDIDRLERLLITDQPVRTALRLSRLQVRPELVELVGCIEQSYCMALRSIAIEQIQTVFRAIDPEGYCVWQLGAGPFTFSADSVEANWEHARKSLMALPHVDVENLKMQILEECRRAWSIFDALPQENEDETSDDKTTAESRRGRKPKDLDLDNEVKRIVASEEARLESGKQDREKVRKIAAENLKRANLTKKEVYASFDRIAQEKRSKQYS